MTCEKIQKTNMQLLLDALAVRAALRHKTQRRERTGEKAADRELKRFWSRVKIGAENDCWNWTKGTDQGYGKYSIGGATLRAHRLSWMIHFGWIGEGLFVCHSCDNPTCINPSHLWLGTSSENTADRDAKNRTAKGDRTGSRKFPERLPHGEHHHRSELTEEIVRKMRTIYASGKATITSKTWKHVQ